MLMVNVIIAEKLNGETVNQQQQKNRHINRKTFLRTTLMAGLGVAGAVGTVGMGSGTARAMPPLVGGRGLVSNASSLANYIMNNYPGVLSIGGVRSDPLPDHPSGRAIDIMVGGNTALGNTIHGDILSQSGRFGVKYTLWQVASHYDHIHVTVF